MDPLSELINEYKHPELRREKERMEERAYYVRMSIVWGTVIILVVSIIIGAVFLSVREDRMNRQELFRQGKAPIQLCTANGGVWDDGDDICWHSPR
jgi:hypothetical protein